MSHRAACRRAVDLRQQLPRFGPLLLAACAAAPSTALQARVPFVEAHGLVFVELDAADGTSLLALLDTGANASAIDPARAGASVVTGREEVMGTTGTFAAEMVEIAGLRLGGLALPALHATRRPLGGLLAPAGRTVEMILGSDAFGAVALTIDFATRQLAVGRSSPGGGVPMILDNGIPAIDGRLGGVPVTLRIDTGASLFDTPDVYVNVPQPVWRELRVLDPGLQPTAHFQGTGAGGETVDLPVAPVSEVTIGPLALPRAFVIVQPPVGYFADPRAKGFVGNNFLRRLGRVTLDYGAGRLRAGG